MGGFKGWYQEWMETMCKAEEECAEEEVDKEEEEEDKDDEDNEQ